MKEKRYNCLTFCLCQRKMFKETQIVLRFTPFVHVYLRVPVLHGVYVYEWFHERIWRVSRFKLFNFFRSIIPYRGYCAVTYYQYGGYYKYE